MQRFGGLFRSSCLADIRRGLGVSLENKGPKDKRAGKWGGDFTRVKQETVKGGSSRLARRVGGYILLGQGK